jgi:hypothetical protein
MRTFSRIVLPAILAVSLGQTTAPTTQPAQNVFRSLRAPADTDLSADPASDFWKPVFPIHITRSVLGDELEGRHLRAQVRSRWTDSHLYFLFICDYEQLTLNAAPNTREETPRLWNKDVVELYIGSTDLRIPPTRYRELQMSPAGEFLDNDIDATVRRPGFNGEEKWNSNFTIKARIDAEKKQWIGEMKIPLAAVEPPHRLPPKPNQQFRLNIYRQDGAGGGPNSANPRTFMAWQPTGVWNPHHPDKFGTLLLTD